MKKIRYLVMDVDGTLTDGKIYMTPSGEMMKAFNVKDGRGVQDILLPAGVTPVTVTGRSSGIVNVRAKEIGITEIYQGITNKIELLNNLTEELDTVAYIGDDINDLPAMYAVRNAGGVIGCPSDAVKTVKSISDYISNYMGGDGAVRDFIEWLFEKGKV